MFFVHELASDGVESAVDTWDVLKGHYKGAATRESVNNFRCT